MRREECKCTYHLNQGGMVMPDGGHADLSRLVEPDRVHHTVYSDPAIFEAEMANIFHKVWIYVGHESQVPKKGDYYTALIGRQPMIMVRHQDGKVHVLFNRCPHRGAMICANQRGNTGKAFACSYHMWQFHTDGTLESIPLPKGYEGTRLKPGDPALNMK